MKPFDRHFSARALLLSLSATLALASTVVRAADRPADIDIYAGVDSNAGAPNVLFFLDNTANWASNGNAWNKTTVYARCALLTDTTQRTACQDYTNLVFGTNTSLTQGQVEVRALQLVISELICKATGTNLRVNVGIMMLNREGSADGNNVVSGYIRKRIAPRQPGDECNELINDLTEIDSKVNTPDYIAPSSSAYGTALFEAFKYFGGWTNPAGAKAGTAGAPANSTGFGPLRYSNKIDFEDPKAFTNGSKNEYLSPITADLACGNNYIVVIGNTWPNQEFGTNVNASPNPTNTQFTRLGYNAGAQFYPKPLLNNDKSDVRFADEWAKFLYDTDVSDIPGVQNIRMFSVDVFNPDAPGNSSDRPKQAALLRSIANQSQTSDAGYFAVGGDVYKLIRAFTDIFTKIASVNSVFTSASLPVSVNAQGTFLNQVFMGVFRPDPDAQQRWAGNLKQFQFKLTGTAPNQALILADKVGDPAVDETKNGGFLDNCAASFWTTTIGTTDNYWENITGFNSPSTCTVKQGTTVNPFSDWPDGPVVERGGAGQRLRSLGHAARNMRTCTDATCSALTSFPTLAQTAANLVLSNWLRGVNTGDGNYDLATNTTSYQQYGMLATATRPTVHGAVVHSRPLAVNYSRNVSGQLVDDVVVFYGAGDGTLRAVNGNKADTDGNELWSFIAPEHFSRLDRVRTNSPLIAYPNVSSSVGATEKDYFFDGSIGGYQERNGTTLTRLWIYPTMRRGGRGVYAFDVTKKPGTDTDQPQLLWRYNESNNSAMGESWSTPTVIRVKGINEPLVVFGAGYNTCEDDSVLTACDGTAGTAGKGIVVLDAEKGPASSNAARLNRFFSPSDGLDSSAGRFAADIATLDVNRDGFVDVLYAVDTRGNVWRINASDPDNGYESFKTGVGPGATASVAAWKINKIATVAQWGTGSDATEHRKFMYAPSAVVLGNQAVVLVGTGDREKPSAGSQAALVKNRFYGLRDNFSVMSDITPTIGYGAAPTDLTNVTNLSSLDPSTVNKGWYRELSTTATPYEQVVTTPLTLGGITYFNTYQAKNASENQCSNLGTGRAYQVNFQTGLPIPGNELVTKFIAGGIPPSPVGGVVVVDGKQVPFVIGGPGPTPISPQKITPKIRADRKPIYRVQRID